MKFADPFPFDRPVDVTLPHGFTGDVEQLRADLATMGLDVRGVEREDPPPAEGEPRVTLTSGPGVAIAEAMRAAGPDFFRRNVVDATESLAALGNAAHEGALELREQAEALAKIRPVVTGGRNRFERRRAASRRWRG